MNFPQLPTDNLYKFMAIVGLIILAGGILIPEYLELQIAKTESFYSNQTSYTNARFTETENAIKFNLKLHGEATKDILEYTENIKKAKSVAEIKELMRLVNEKVNEQENLLSKNDVLFQEFNKIRESMVALSETESVLTFLKRKSVNIRYTSYISIIFGFILSISGFFLWYIRVQKYQDADIKSIHTKSMMMPSVPKLKRPPHRNHAN